MYIKKKEQHTHKVNSLKTGFIFTHSLENLANDFC